jgi:GNAT superfamily N-acetyltransferase
VGSVGSVGSARAVRSSRSACIPRPAPQGGRFVCLRDGSVAILRPLERSDGPLLVDGFSRLSPQSRRARFLITKNELTARDVASLTDVDHHDREAIAAVDPATGRGIGVARYVRDANCSTAAEVAITVVDEWHRRGLGAQLAEQLVARAAEEGIRNFAAVASLDNTAVISMLRRLPVDVDVVSVDEDVIEYDITLRSA